MVLRFSSIRSSAPGSPAAWAADVGAFWWHARAASVVVAGLLLANLALSPDSLWVARVAAVWGVLLALHLGVLAAGAARAGSLRTALFGTEVAEPAPAPAVVEPAPRAEPTPSPQEGPLFPAEPAAARPPAAPKATAPLGSFAAAGQSADPAPAEPAKSEGVPPPRANGHAPADRRTAFAARFGVPWSHQRTPGASNGHHANGDSANGDSANGHAATPPAAANGGAGAPEDRLLTVTHAAGAGVPDDVAALWRTAGAASGRRDFSATWGSRRPAVPEAVAAPEPTAPAADEDPDWPTLQDLVADPFSHPGEPDWRSEAAR